MDEQKKVVQDGKSMVCTCCGHYGGGAGCACGCGYGHGHWGGHFIFRIVIALAVALFMFWAGVKVGEIKSQLGGFGGRHGGYYMMGGYGGYNGYGGMMAPYGTAVPAVPPAATTPAK